MSGICADRFGSSHLCGGLLSARSDAFLLTHRVGFSPRDSSHDDDSPCGLGKSRGVFRGIAPPSVCPQEPALPASAPVPSLLPRVIRQRWIHGARRRASLRLAKRDKPEACPTALAEVVAGACVPDSIALWLRGLKRLAKPTDARRRVLHNTARYLVPSPRRRNAQSRP